MRAGVLKLVREAGNYRAKISQLIRDTKFERMETEMGQAFDRNGNVLGEAFGDTKREVFDKLTAEFKDAHEIRIRSLSDKVVERADEASKAQ